MCVNGWKSVYPIGEQTGVYLTDRVTGVITTEVVTQRKGENGKLFI